MLTREMILRPVKVSFRPWVILLFVLCPPMWVLVWWAFWGVPWDSPSATNWVQAVGSIGAILIAIWVSHSERRSQDSDQRARECHYMEKALIVVAYMNEQITHIDDSFKEDPVGKGGLKVFLSSLEDAFADVTAFQFAAMADFDFARSWIKCKRPVPLLLAQLRAYLNSEKNEAQLTADFLAKNAPAHLAAMTAALESFSLKVGAPIRASPLQ